MFDASWSVNLELRNLSFSNIAICDIYEIVHSFRPGEVVFLQQFMIARLLSR